MKLLWLWGKKMCLVFIEIDVWNCWVGTNTSLPSRNDWKEIHFCLSLVPFGCIGFLYEISDWRVHL